MYVLIILQWNRHNGGEKKSRRDYCNKIHLRQQMTLSKKKKQYVISHCLHRLWVKFSLAKYLYFISASAGLLIAILNEKCSHSFAAASTQSWNCWLQTGTWVWKCGLHFMYFICRDSRSACTLQLWQKLLFQDMDVSSNESDKHYCS